MENIVVAIDSFKGCISSAQANGAMAQGLLRGNSQSISVISVPVADGGDGLLEAFSHSLPHRMISVDVVDALRRPIRSSYAILSSGTAVIEMALASGIALLDVHDYDALHASSHGTGLLIAHAVAHGCSHIILGIGGSASTDGGLGLLQALGFKIFDASNHEILNISGANMAQVARISAENVSPQVLNCRFTVASDVTNPFAGEMGAAHVFAPQKGATPAMVDFLDNGLNHLAHIYSLSSSRFSASLPGAGAAGGVGGALLTFFNSSLTPGAELLFNLIGFDDILSNASLVITGEGAIDRQTLMGKLPSHILSHASALNVPVIAVAGKVSDKEALINAGFNDIININLPNTSLKKALLPEVACRNLEVVGCSIAFNLLK